MDLEKNMATQANKAKTPNVPNAQNPSIVHKIMSDGRKGAYRGDKLIYARPSYAPRVVKKGMTQEEIYKALNAVPVGAPAKPAPAPAKPAPAPAKPAAPAKK